MNSQTGHPIEGAQPVWWKIVFACDARSLAVFRILLGVIAILDVSLRWPDIESLYSDSGYFTRQLVSEYFEKHVGPAWYQFIWSVHMASGDVRVQQAFFCLQAAAGLALALGAATRWVTLAAWVLVASAQIRNPLVITSGDMLFKLLLFWSIFLPLGRLWSIDAWRGGRNPGNVRLRVANVATAGIILQVILMYFFTGVAKYNDVWFNGVAMDFVYRLDLFTNAWGKQMVEYTTLNRIVSWATLFLELVAIWFLLIPWKNSWWRLGVMAAYWAFHLGIALTMTIGLFPLICMVAWLPLLPREVWRRTEPRGTLEGESPNRSQLNRSGYLVAQAICGLMIAIAICWNLYNLKTPSTKFLMPRPLAVIGHWAALYQHFQMFGVPPKHNPWFAFDATLNDGSRVDIFCTDGIVHERPPEHVRDTIPGHNWRRLLHNLVSDEVAEFRQPLLDYAVRRWNANHPDSQHVRSAQLVNYLQALGPDYRAADWIGRSWGSYPQLTDDPGKAIDSMLDRFLNEK